MTKQGKGEADVCEGGGSVAPSAGAAAAALGASSAGVLAAGASASAAPAACSAPVAPALAAEFPSITYQAVFALVAAAMGGRPLSLPPNVDYQAVYHELCQHAILGLTRGLVDALPLDESLRARWAGRAMRELRANMGVQYAEQQAVDVLEAAGVPCVILKGAGAAIYYPDTMMRARGDVDVLVRPEDCPHAIAALEAQGWEMPAEVRASEQAYPGEARHVAFVKDEFHLELHRMFYGGRGNGSLSAADQRLMDALPRCEKRAVSSSLVPLLPDAENGLVLLAHLRQHLVAGVGLRHVVDWMAFVQQVCSDEFWRESFDSLAQEQGLVPLAKATTLICRDYLGLSAPVTWCDADAPARKVRDELLAYIMSQGNFGVKQAGTANTVTQVLTKRRSPLQWARYLQSSGCHHWPLAQRNRLARCFAWAYQIGRYARLGSQGNTARGLVEQHAESARRRAIFEALGLDA